MKRINVHIIAFIFSTLFTLSISAQTWQSGYVFMDNPLSITQVKAVDNYVSWGIGSNGRLAGNSWLFNFAQKGGFLFRSNNGGNSWSPAVTPGVESQALQSIAAVSLRQAWVATYELENRRPRIWRTLNGGLNWQDVSPEFQTRSYISYIHFWTHMSGIIIGDDPGDGCFEIHITEDGGNTWRRVPCANFRGDTEGSRRIAFNKVNVNNQGNIQFITHDLYEEGKGGKVYESNNYGRRWSVSETGMGQGSMVAYRYAGFGLAVHNKSKRDTLSCRVMRTNADSGEWEDITPKDSSFAFFDLKYIPGTFNLVATVRNNNNRGPFKTILSEDDGTTWRVLDSLTPIMSLDFVNDYTGYGGKYNSGSGRTELYAFNFKSLTDTATSAATTEARRAALSTDGFSAAVSPNPFDNELIINMNVKKAGQVSINLFDITGRMVWSKKSEAGVNSVFSEKIETSSLSNGTYILRILSNDQLIQHKLVKQ